MTINVRPIPSAQAWFAAGVRLGYDPEGRAIVTAQSAPLNVFVRGEGDLAHAVTFLPGFPDGSFGWAKVLPHLPSAIEMPKLFVEYVGMGDSDKPKDYAYSTAERTDLVEAIWRDHSVQSTTLVAFDFSSLVVLEHLRRRLERAARGEPVGGPEIRGVSSSTVGSLPMGIRTRGTQRRSCAAFPSAPGAVWADPFPDSRWQPG
jgi:pimeloyl-ACP methyl ester carboxylesterase